MKLTLQHLAGYLPYGLKGISKEENLGIEIVKGFSTYGKDNIINIITDVDDIDLIMFKPILRPLSDLTRKELELEGFDSYIDYLTYENKGSQWTLKAPFNMVQYLLSQHFDIYNLIQNNLAIDKNTIL